MVDFSFLDFASKIFSTQGVFFHGPQCLRSLLIFPFSSASRCPNNYAALRRNECAAGFRTVLTVFPNQPPRTRTGLVQQLSPNAISAFAFGGRTSMGGHLPPRSSHHDLMRRKHLVLQLHQLFLVHDMPWHLKYSGISSTAIHQFSCRESQLPCKCNAFSNSKPMRLQCWFYVTRRQSLRCHQHHKCSQEFGNTQRMSALSGWRPHSPWHRQHVRDRNRFQAARHFRATGHPNLQYKARTKPSIRFGMDAQL